MNQRTVPGHVISISEVQGAIKALQNNKAAGPDGLSGEFFKHSAPCVVLFLTEYFNKLISSGTFPSEWSESVITPTYKMGDIYYSPDNYRGVSLLNVSGKLYGYILNKRLTQWIEDNKFLTKRKRASDVTLVQLITCSRLVQKQLLSHGKLLL